MLIRVYVCVGYVCKICIYQNTGVNAREKPLMHRIVATLTLSIPMASPPFVRFKGPAQFTRFALLLILLEFHWLILHPRRLSLILLVNCTGNRALVHSLSTRV